jgi:glycylpeptide N-tetradecanoyltransferase
MILEYNKYTLEWLVPTDTETWGIAIRDTKGKLVGYITGTPSNVTCGGNDMRVMFINLLCIHKKFRSRGFAPVLIKEVTRRAVSRGITQAIYTAVTKLPTPLITATYLHRILNVESARACGFFQSAKPVKNALDVRGRSFMREIDEQDLPQLQRLLYVHGTRYKLTMTPTREYVQWLMPRKGIVHSFISEEGDKFVSFYRIGYRYKATGVVLEMAYLMHAIGKDSVRDAVILAKNAGYDVLNSLNIGGRDLESNKFVAGTSDIHYYLYNWNPGALTSEDVEVILP